MLLPNTFKELLDSFLIIVGGQQFVDLTEIAIMG